MPSSRLIEKRRLFYTQQGLKELVFRCVGETGASRATVRATYNRLFREMGDCYRNEDYFKQVIFESHLSGCLCPEIEVAFSEFQVGNSIADLLFCNGSITIYEIKTGLDKLERLDTQLHDYRKICSFVWIVCDLKHIPLIKERYLNTSIGLAYINEAGVLVTEKEATEDCSFLDVSSLLSLLRKDELKPLCQSFGINIANDCLFGFKARRALGYVLTAKEAELAVRNALKARKKLNVGFEKLPRSVQCFAYSMNPNDYQSFIRLLPMKYIGGIALRAWLRF